MQCRLFWDIVPVCSSLVMKSSRGGFSALPASRLRGEVTPLYCAITETFKGAIIHRRLRHCCCQGNQYWRVCCKPLQNAVVRNRTPAVNLVTIYPNSQQQHSAPATAQQLIAGFPPWRPSARSHVRPGWICGGKSGTRISFLRVLGFPC
jgi:hypothetical protein